MENKDAKILKSFLLGMRAGGKDFTEGEDWLAGKKSEYTLIRRVDLTALLEKLKENAILMGGIYNHTVN